MDETLKREAVRNMRKNPSSRTRENEYWSEEELERLRTMFDDGEDFTDIAFVLQRGETAVMQQALLMNLYSRKPRPRKQQKRRRANVFADSAAVIREPVHTACT